MKWVIALAVVAGGIGCCLYWHPWAPAAAAVASSAPASPLPAAPAPAPAVVKHIAPPGVYYLTQPVSVTSDSGIATLTAGTKVTFVKARGKNWVVTDGETQAEVTQDQLTNDLDAADAALKGTLDQAAAAAASVRNQQELVQKAAQDQAAALEKERQWEAATRAAAAAARAATPAPAEAPAPASAPENSSNSNGTPPPFGRPAPP